MQNFLPRNLEFLRKSCGLTQAEAASSLGLPRTTYINYEKGQTNPDPLLMVQFSDHFQVSIDDLLRKPLSKGNLMAASEMTRNREKGNLKGNPIGNLIQHIEESTPTYGKKQFLPSIITVDNAGRENILYVPVSARMGYRNGGYRDAGYLSKLQSFSFPGLRNGTFRMFETEGVSMAPTVGPGYVIAQYVESISDVKDNRVYAVVLKEGFVVKRLLNRVSERGKLVLKSDTIAHRSEYPTEEIGVEKVLEIWEAKIKISTDFSPPSAIYEQITALESNMVEQRQFNEAILIEIADFRQLIKAQMKPDLKRGK